MSLQKAEAYLESKGFLDHVITLGESTATVALAAQALGVQNDCKDHVLFTGGSGGSDSDRRDGEGR